MILMGCGALMAQGDDGYCYCEVEEDDGVVVISTKKMVEVHHYDDDNCEGGKF